jgi:hypothetical protein
MLRRMMIPVVLFLCAFPLWAQVEARQATPWEAGKAAQATQTEVSSPMLLEVPLAVGGGTTWRLFLCTYFGAVLPPSRPA